MEFLSVLTCWPALFSISFKWVTPHFWQQNCPVQPSTSLRQGMWTLITWLLPTLLTCVTTAWHTQCSKFMTSLTATGDDRNLVASHPVIALIFHIFPPLFVSRVKSLDELEPVKRKNKTQSFYMSAVSVTSPTGHSMTFNVHLRLTWSPCRLGGRWACPRECVCVEGSS